VGVAAAWTRAKIRRNDRDEIVDILEVDCMGVTIDPSSARAALAGWAQADRERDYYRLRDRSGGTVAVWDRKSRDCWWYDSRTRTQEVLPEPTVAEPLWSIESQRLIDVARLEDLRVAALQGI
jgi:hypothetical protein